MQVTRLRDYYRACYRAAPPNGVTGRGGEDDEDAHRVSPSASTPGAVARMRPARVKPPRPLLSPEAESQLTPRQREVLDELESSAVEAGLGELTMADLAARMNCSLRTLYGLARSRDELLLTVVDRRLHRIGRVAMAAITPAMGPLEALRAYLRAATVAVGPTTESFAREFGAVPGAGRLIDEHERYVVAVTRWLLDRAVGEGEIQPVHTGALALVLGGLGRDFSRPDVISRLETSPKGAADAVTDVILRGLERWTA